MQPRPSFDRSLLIPIAIAAVSILGIGWLLSITDLGSRLAETFIQPTAIPSSLGPLEEGTLTPSDSISSAQKETLYTATSTETPTERPTETLTPTSTATETPPTPSATPTPAGIELLGVGKYDDTDPRIVYDMYWIPLKNASTLSSYKGTIHASYNTGSEASFRFTGQGFRLGYKRGKSFGTVTVMIDDQPSGFNEQDFSLVWNSPKLSPGDHFVRIIHDSGESINLDYIVILE